MRTIWPLTSSVESLDPHRAAGPRVGGSKGAAYDLDGRWGAACYGGGGFLSSGLGGESSILMGAESARSRLGVMTCTTSTSQTRAGPVRLPLLKVLHHGLPHQHRRRSHRSRPPFDRVTTPHTGYAARGGAGRTRYCDTTPPTRWAGSGLSLMASSESGVEAP